jgi:D-alanyl-lipoteichoic acid acyltransferase DltB (MBOAT superfamily)
MPKKRGKGIMFSLMNNENRMMKDRKGQELSTNTIILIILGVVVLVILVLGFTIGWQNVLPWLSSNNVNTIVNQCQASCTTSDVYGYCSLARTLVASDLPNNQKQIVGNCSFFSTNSAYTKYGIVACSNLCPQGNTTG